MQLLILVQQRQLLVVLRFAPFVSNWVSLTLFLLRYGFDLETDSTSRLEVLKWEYECLMRSFQLRLKY
jgi:hypothetical protein